MFDECYNQTIRQCIVLLKVKKDTEINRLCYSLIIFNFTKILQIITNLHNFGGKLSKPLQHFVVTWVSRHGLMNTEVSMETDEVSSGSEPSKLDPTASEVSGIFFFLRKVEIDKNHNFSCQKIFSFKILNGYWLEMLLNSENLSNSNTK